MLKECYHVLHGVLVVGLTERAWRETENKIRKMKGGDQNTWSLCFSKFPADSSDSPLSMPDGMLVVKLVAVGRVLIKRWLKQEQSRVREKK